MVQFCYPEVRSCIRWAGCGSYPWLTILALILISFSTDEIYDSDRVTLNGLNNVPIGFPLQRSAKEGDMGWPSHPIAICTACGAPIEDPRFINDRCTRRVDGRRCNGTYGITMSPRDWKRCGSCSGLGFRGDRRCNLCWGTGWAYVGEKNY